MSGTTTYQVRYRVKGSTTWINYGQPVTDLTEVISGLKPNTTYEMEVVATNPQGAVASNIITFTTGSTTPPSAPGLPIASGITQTSLVLNWPASSSGAQPIVYQPQMRLHSTGSFVNVGLPGFALSTTVTGLTANTSYDFQVIATNVNGSATSQVLTVSTAAVGTAPSAPSALRVSNITSGSVTLAWTGSTGTAPITYQPRYRVAGTTSFTSFGNPTSSASVNITGLAANTNYEFRVDAINSVATTVSTLLPATTLGTSTAPSAPSGLVASGQSQTGMTISWSASTGTPAPTYQLQYRVGATGSFANYGSPISGTSINVTGLVTSTTYNFQVVASNSAGSATSTVLSAATTSAPVAPSAPLNPTIGAVTSSSIAVSWTHPTQGSDPLQYQLQWRQHPAAGAAAGLFSEDFSALNINETGGSIPSATITPASGGSITDLSGNVWTISGGAVFENGSAAGFSSNVAKVVLVNGVIWHENTTNQWYSWSPPSTWNPGTDPTGSQDVPLALYAGVPGDAASGAYPGFNAQWDGFTSTMGRAATLCLSYMNSDRSPTDGTFGWAAQASFYSGQLKGNTRTVNAIPVIAWPFGYDPGTGAVSVAAAIAAGTHDTLIQTCLGSWKANGYSTLYIRPAWEFNIGGAQAVPTVTTLANFLAAFQHFYTLVHNYAASNGMTIKVIWNPNVGNNQNSTGLTVAQQYPGDAFVDVLGIDTYGAPVDGTNPPTNTTSDPTQYLVSTMFNMAVSSQKPVAFCEVGGIDTTFATQMGTALNGRPAGAAIEFFAMWDIDDSSGNLSWTNAADSQTTLANIWKGLLGAGGTVRGNLTGSWMNHYAFGGSEYTLSANNEAQYYASATRTPGFNPFSVSGGVLTITADSVAHTVANPLSLPYNSGAIVSAQESSGAPAVGLFSHMYGYFEARCQLPKGRGLWPAFWLLPLTGPGEIDIFEQLGHDTTTIYCSLHATTGGGSVTVPLGFDASAGMHVYGCDWQSDFITMYVDNVQVAQFPTPSDMIGKPYYILFNLAVGGTGSWPGPPDGTTVFPARMQIDYVHAYDKRPF